MLQQERHEQILARLNTEGKVKVKELANDFEVTEDCIRKDLTALEKEGLLKKEDRNLYSEFRTCQVYLSKKYITYNYYKYD